MRISKTNKSIAILVASLTFIGCSHADMDDYSSATGLPSFIFTQFIPDNLCGTYYHIKEWNDSDDRLNISPEGIVTYQKNGMDNFADTHIFYIDYANNKLFYKDNTKFDYDILHLNEKYFFYKDKNSILHVLSKNPNATLAASETLSYLHEINGTFLGEDSTLLVIEPNGNVRLKTGPNTVKETISYSYNSMLTLKNNILELDDADIQKTHIISLSNSKNNIYKINGDKEYKRIDVTKLQETLCGQWYHMDEWGYIYPKREDLHINSDATCINSLNKIVGAIDYTNSIYHRCYNIAYPYTIEYFTEEHLILTDEERYFWIYSKNKNNNIINIKPDSKIVGVWTDNENPNWFITIGEEGDISAKSDYETSTMCFTINGILYLKKGLSIFKDILTFRYSYIVNGNTLTIGDKTFTKISN